MLVVRIYNHDTKELINTFELNKNDMGFEALYEIERMQQRGEDPLKLGVKGLTELGIRTIYHRGTADTTIPSEGTYSSREGQSNVVINGKELPLKVDVVMYKKGWVISIGKRGTNILGGQYDCYLSSIGTRNIRARMKADAHCFSTLDSILKYIKNHEDIFKYCVKEHGYQWGIELGNDYFREDLEGLSPKKKDTIRKQEEEVSSVLNSINALIDESNDSARVDNLPSIVDDNALKKEAIDRMRKLGLWAKVIDAFRRSNIVYQSEHAGIIFDLDPKAQAACKVVMDDDKIPYHVVKTSYRDIGDVYAVLYVSKDVEDWQYERPDNRGILMCYGYNATNEYFSEYGDCMFQSANGGLVRVS